MQLAAPATWIEAVVATPGTGPDAVREPAPGTVATVPHDAMKLRLINALDTKRLKQQEYMDKGYILADDPLVVAVNAAPISSALLEQTVPRIVSSVYPIGNEVWRIDRRTAKVVDSSFEYQASVTKAQGAPVNTDLFLRDEYHGVSGALYAWSNAFNRPNQPGAEFVLVHCLTSRAKIAVGSLPCGNEYWADGSLIHHRAHSWPWIGGA
jgi:hypothetical protein